MWMKWTRAAMANLPLLPPHRLLAHHGQAKPDWHITEMVCEDNVNFDQFLKNELKPKK